MKLKLKSRKSRPRVGAVRRRFKFCWWPRKTDDKFLVWLESILITEKYTQLTRLIPESKEQSYSAWLITESFSNKSTLYQEYHGKI